MAAYVRCSTQLYTEFVHEYTIDTVRGTIELVNDVYGFNHVAVDVSVEDEATFIYKCPAVVIGKKSGTGEAISKGERVYGDPADDYDVSATKSVGYLYLGIALEDAAASDTTVDIEYDGTLHDVL